MLTGTSKVLSDVPVPRIRRRFYTFSDLDVFAEITHSPVLLGDNLDPLQGILPVSLFGPWGTNYLGI